MTSGNRQKHESKNPIQRALIARFKREAAALVRRAAPKTILDLGCGEGFMIEALLQAGVEDEFTGVDRIRQNNGQVVENRIFCDHPLVRALVAD